MLHYTTLRYTTDTEAENYRAYKLFSMMDVDGGGSISLRELYRVLLGEVTRHVGCTFAHPDSGIFWGVDEENCVIVQQIEEASLAGNFPFLIERMRVFSINGVEIPLYDPKAIEQVYSELLKLYEEPVEMQFREPLLIINKFSCVLDMEVEGRLYSITLPVGAVYNLEIFRKKIMQAMRHVDPLLERIIVDFVPRQRQLFFKSKKLQFRLLFATGPNYRRSCRYALGFNAEDTPYGNYFIGQPMLIDLNLGLSEEQTEILMVELFHKFDRDNSGEFEFEEFRDFYIKYLDTEESLELMRQYGQHRFRDIEFEKYCKNLKLQREQKARRRAYMKEKYKDTVAAQQARFFANSHVDRYGNRRRLYRHRGAEKTDGSSVKESQKSVAQLLAESGIKLDGILPYADSGSMGADDSSSVKSGALIKAVAAAVQQQGSGQSIATDMSDPRNQEQLIASVKAAALRKHESMKRKQQGRNERHKERRQKILKTIIEANKALHAKDRADARKFEEGKQNATMMEAHYAIKKALLKSMRMRGTDFENINSVGIDAKAGAASPALRIESGILNTIVDFDDIQLDELGPKFLHPAAQRYFFVRESKKRNADFNAQVGELVVFYELNVLDITGDASHLSLTALVKINLYSWY